MNGDRCAAGKILNQWRSNCFFWRWKRRVPRLTVLEVCSSISPHGQKRVKVEAHDILRSPPKIGISLSWVWTPSFLNVLEPYEEFPDSLLLIYPWSKCHLGMHKHVVYLWLDYLLCIEICQGQNVLILAVQPKIRRVWGPKEKFSVRNSYLSLVPGFLATTGF